MKRTIFVTGGRGFIGSHLVLNLLERYTDDIIVNIDAVTYAARPHLFKPEEYKNYAQEIVDIRDQSAVSRVMRKWDPDLIFHLAAESHVCRSITGPKDFIDTNVNGTFNLIEEFRQLRYPKGYIAGTDQGRFIHVSTDEVFGELLPHEAPFNPMSQIKPRSPYAASKAASDHIVMSYHHTYGVSTVVTNCSNNFGPNQHQEKLIPRTILRLMNGQHAELYGDGDQIRDWLSVDDHVDALIAVSERGLSGARYTIGGENEMTNLQMVRAIHDQFVMATGINSFFSAQMNRLARPTDDLRYAVDCSAIRAIGWAPPKLGFFDDLRFTVKWYLDNFQNIGLLGSTETKDGSNT